MNMQIACLLAVICTNILLVLGFVLAFLYLQKTIKIDTDLKREMFMFSLPINDSDNFNILDNLIKHESDMYQVYNFPSYVEDMYITEEDQNKMLKTVLSNVLKKISPIYMNKLKYIYNEDIIEDIIFEKVRDAVLNVSVEINGQFADSKK